MNIFHAFILGIVEGVTEFLPVSSTAHLMLAGRLLGLAQTDFLKTFEIAIQLGAVLAVVVLFFRRLLTDPVLMRHMVAGFIPTGIAGLVLYPLVRAALGRAEIALIGMFLGGIAILLFEKRFRSREAPLTTRQAFFIGCMQPLAFIPGISRALATIMAAMALGLPRRTAVEFSFLLAVPTIAAAALYDTYKNVAAFSPEHWDILIIGFITAFLSALASVRLFMQWAKTRPMSPFGWYRIGLVLILGALWMFAPQLFAALVP